MRTTTARAILAAAALTAACASNPARSSVVVPLEIPEPPPRASIEPVTAVVEESEPELPLPPPPEPAVRTSPRSPAVPAASAPPPAASPPPAVEEPARPAPAPELRPGGPAGRTPTAAQVQESLRRARQKLDAIDRGRLNAGKRADYDSARQFLAQAETAVKENNLLLAESSADKAETLANGLR